MPNKIENSRFVIVIIVAHTLAYLLAGGVTYQLITKSIWNDPNSLLGTYLRTPTEPELWNFAMVWQIPAQLLRGLLMGLALLPLSNALKDWTTLKKAAFFGSLFFVFTHISASAPSPANLEGIVYMKPEFIQLGFAKMQVEMILHSIIAGFIFARYAYKKLPQQATIFSK